MATCTWAMSLIDGRTTVFDGIEFNDDFRWIDTISDLAFMAMDLSCHDRPDLAHRLVNAVLEGSDDFAGARVLRYYQVHRALVRAGGRACSAQAVGWRRRRPWRSRGAGLAQAEARARPGRLSLEHHPRLFGQRQEHGAQALVESAGAIRIRADVERKRLFAAGRRAQRLGPGRRPVHARGHGRHLRAPVRPGRAGAAGGLPVVLDASFLRRS
jgi:hypothetical protein